MSIVVVTLLSLAILVVGFLVGWLVGGLGAGLSGIAFLALPVLVIGFLIGWLVEWIIDNQYRRMRELGLGPVSVPLVAQSAPVGGEITELARAVKDVLAEREGEVNTMRVELEEQGARFDRLQAEFDHYAATHPDDLTTVKGIGRIYQWKLRDGGISTFAQLASTTPDRICEVLQVEKWQKVDPQSWIDQAKVLIKRD